MPQIHEYYPCPPDKVFWLASPAHMLSKLGWEIGQLRKALERERYGVNDVAAYHAFNCSVTAWHLADWIWEASPPQHRKYILKQLGTTASARENLGLFQTSIREKCQSIHICRQLAIGAKHMTVNSHPDPKVRAELLWESVQSGENEDESSLINCCRLVIWDGEIQRSPVNVFEDAFHFWERCLREWGFMEARFIDGKEP